MLWIISTLVFVLLRIAPGDPVDAILGTRANELARDSLRIKPGTITVRVGMPIEVDGLKMEDRNELTEGARNAVMQLQAQGAQTEIEPIGGG